MKFVGVPGDHEYKVGYQDKANPERIKWRILLNALSRYLECTRSITDIQRSWTGVESTFRAVRYPTQPSKILNVNENCTS